MPIDNKTANAVQMLSARLRKSDRKLKKWAKREGLDCYRVFDRDIPEIPLAIDRYGSHLVIHVYNSERTHAALVDALVQCAATTLDVQFERVHLKARGGPSSAYEKLDDQEETFEVREAGLTFLVNLNDYLDTGLFLDHRKTRARVRDEAQQRRVLNLFAYTGAFSVYAAAGGASEVVTVDLSRRYLRWAQDNFAANGIDADPRFSFVRADAREFLERARDEEKEFDLIVLDPPTRSVSKAMEGEFEIQRDHVELLEATVALLAPGGVLYFSTNLRTFNLAPNAFADISFEEITKTSVPLDFPRSAPHRCWRAERPIEFAFKLSSPSS